MRMNPNFESSLIVSLFLLILFLSLLFLIVVLFLPSLPSTFFNLVLEQPDHRKIRKPRKVLSCKALMLAYSDVSIQATQGFDQNLMSFPPAFFGDSRRSLVGIFSS